MTFEQAKARYVHRFTMEHTPAWALVQMPNGKHYAPQFRTDSEWFRNTIFPPNNPIARSKRDTSCYTSNQTWPLGLYLTKPYKRVAR